MGLSDGTSTRQTGTMKAEGPVYRDGDRGQLERGGGGDGVRKEQSLCVRRSRAGPGCGKLGVAGGAAGAIEVLRGARLAWMECQWNGSW